MNDIFYYKNFCFNFFTFKQYKYTDKRTGSPFHYLAYIIKGHSKLVSDDISITVSPGELFYIPKGLSYQSYWNSEDDIQFLSFGFHHFPETGSKQFVLQKIDCDEQIKELIKNIPMKKEADSFVIGAFYTVLSKIVAHLESKPINKKNQILDTATRYIYDNPNCSVADVAAYCHISKSELYYIFKNKSDFTPNELIQKIRCEKAEAMLTTTDKLIQEISEALGFSSASYFRKILKFYTGKTPREIRNQARNI